jgi:hypothetical protein
MGTTPNPQAVQDLKYFFLGMGIGIGLATQPEITLPMLPKVVPALVH